ncbi:olfactory receptor 10A2-like [Alligator sinensis]|uniref:Olfactory receptor n=1 Tax=Alligator sinensis TaxID=38654 RepID=A0A1U8DR75_ALLSI|nr:olfactory receptor 10A2-like [Alligator sinensis]
MNYFLISADGKQEWDMTGENRSVVTHFFFEPFSNIFEVQATLFFLVLLMFIIDLGGNILIIVITLADPVLHSPMYFFLRNLSCVEISYTSSTIPNMLLSFFSKENRISFLGCAMQLNFFALLGITECFVLAAMAYDRYVAICHPLHYMTMMNRRVCFQLLAVSWLMGVLVGVGQTASTFTLPFCGPNKKTPFFCDLPPLLKLVCVNTYRNEIITYAVTIIFIMVPFMLILMSYACILQTILKIPSAESRKKTFSTCSSHLIVVTLFYGSGIVTYLRPKSFYSLSSDKLLSLFYTLMSPMLNPLIYSLRNKEVKQTLKRLISRKIYHSTV